jgi:hypothetical protein
MIRRHRGEVGVDRHIALLKLNLGYRWSGWFFKPTFRTLFPRERIQVLIKEEADLSERVWKGENSQRPNFQP